MGVCHSNNEDCKIFYRLKYTDYYDFKPNISKKEEVLKEIQEENSENSIDSESQKKTNGFESQTENLEESDISEKKSSISLSN